MFLSRGVPIMRLSLTSVARMVCGDVLEKKKMT